MDTVVLETERLLARYLLSEDRTLLHAIMSDSCVMRYVWDYQSATLEQLRDFIDKCVRESGDRGWTTWPLIFKEEKSLTGYCGFLVRDYGEYKRETEIGWLIAREYWGRGLATEAAKAVVEFGFSKWQFNRVITSARPEDTQSVRVMGK